MTRQLQERLSATGALVAILAFAITYGKTVDPLIALGAIGVAYLWIGPILLLVLERYEKLELPPIFPKIQTIPLVLATLLWWGF